LSSEPTAAIYRVRECIGLPPDPNYVDREGAIAAFENLATKIQIRDDCHLWLHCSPRAMRIPTLTTPYSRAMRLLAQVIA
jgi:hypothetical protein